MLSLGTAPLWGAGLCSGERLGLPSGLSRRPPLPPGWPCPRLPLRCGVAWPGPAAAEGRGAELRRGTSEWETLPRLIFYLSNATTACRKTLLKSHCIVTKQLSRATLYRSSERERVFGKELQRHCKLFLEYFIPARNILFD